jgi:hypothetical protein
LVHKSTFYSCLNFDTIYKLITLKYVFTSKGYTQNLAPKILKAHIEFKYGYQIAEKQLIERQIISFLI